MLASNIRIDNVRADVAAVTKYVVRWQGMKTSELEYSKKMPFYRAMWLQGLWLFALRDLLVWLGL